MMVHPWQIKHILQSDYRDELNEKLILISNHSVPYYAGLSFRTLVPKQPDLSPHIKLSTNVHITGEIRTLSEQTTYNGPLVTQILREIMSKMKIFHIINLLISMKMQGYTFIIETTMRQFKQIEVNN